MRSLALLFSLLVIAPTTQATIINVEPDAYTDGVVLTNAYSSVTLSVQGRQAATIIAINGYDTSRNRNLATTGSLVFGYTPVLSPIPSGQVWDENNYGLLRADFDVATNFVSIDLIYDDDDTGVLYAFDASGNLLESVTALGDGRGSSSIFCPPYCDPFTTVSISRSSNDIAYILAGGQNLEALFLDNMQYNYVPVPSAEWLFVSGLAALALGMRNGASD